MDSLEQSREDSGTAERLTASFAVLWAEHRRLATQAEQWVAIESSTAWALAKRLAQWRRYLAPEGSWRQACLRLFLRGFRLRRREPVEMPVRSTSQGERGCVSAPRKQLGALTQPRSPALPAPQGDKFRVAYIGSQFNIDAASMRYRTHNLIEALGLAGLECTFVPQEEIRAQLHTILSHDLIVLVRRMRDDAITALIGSARRRGLPIVYDIDDYIFDPWVMPYVEAFHDPMNQAKVLRFMDELGACLDQCDYFTGSTPYLSERAAALGKESFVIHNGLNSTQLILSQQAREQRSNHRDGRGTRIGYFSGTRTHQADFRIVYPALMRLLQEERSARLTIVGHLDLGAFPGLAPFMDRIDILPTCHWSELPAVIAGVDVNLIPLELTPFNEGKSNLKYFEAGLVEVPSIASPTRILCDSISHGHNGLLAQTTEEWYDALKGLIARPDWRRQMGRNALEHVMRNYTPAAIGAEAAAVYRQILHFHRVRSDIPKQTLSIVMLIANPQSEWDEALRRADELAAAGHAVTVLLRPGETSDATAALEKSIVSRFIEPFFTVQHGGEIPRCDVLLAIDPYTRDAAIANQHRARLTVADEELLSALQGAGRGLESLLRDWVQNGPAALPSAEAA